jgi:hypothetical protein
MKYKRLASSRCGLGKWHTLWLGDDHLLAVESNGYSEEYARYYLKDIQAIVTRRSSWGKVLNAVSGSLAAISLFAGIGGYENGPSPVSVTAAIFGGFFLLLLLWNLFRGPTCCCQIRTPVGIEKLPALDRTRSVRKVLNRLRPLIGQLQGGITRKEIIELTGKYMDTPPAVSSAALGLKGAGSAPPVAENTISPYRGGLHRAAFLLLIADAGLSLLQILHNSKALVILSTFVEIAFLFLAIIVLVKLQSRPAASLAKWMTWGGLATMVAGSVISYFFMIFLNIGKIKPGTTQDQLFDFYAAIEPADHPSFATFLLAFAVVTAVIGIAGLIALGREQRSFERRRP